MTTFEECKTYFKCDREGEYSDDNALSPSVGLTWQAGYRRALSIKSRPCYLNEHLNIRGCSRHEQYHFLRILQA